MTNTTNLVKKAFSVAVAATTILWSVGLSAFLPVAASAATFGDLIKGTTLSTVYYYGSDGQRYAFPNEKTYFSWNKDFSAVKTISDSQLASITLAGNIVYRPGARWIKITSDNKVYVVSTSGKIRWVENEATAKGLGGDAWNTHIDDVPDVFFTNYTVGDSLTSAAAGYDGMLWSDGTSKYLVAGTKYQKVTDAGFAANGYNAGFVLMGTGFTKSGLTAGTDITAAMANLTDAAQKVTTPTYAVSQNVSVALSASSPASGTVIASQALAPLVAFDFTNPTSAPVVVKSVALHRTGVSSDTTLSNVYLFSGFTRLTDSATVSNGLASWNDAGGLFTIPAGGTVTVSARSDIANVSGQTLGLALNAAADVTFVGAFAAAGTFPVNGALFTVASAPSNYAAVSLGTAASYVATNASATPSNDYSVWQDQVTVGTNGNGAWLEAIRVRNTGSIAAGDVNNWRFYVAGVQQGAAVASQDVNGYVTFDLSAKPLHLNTQTHTFKVMADVIGGTTRTLTVGIRSAADLIIYDNDYKQAVFPVTSGTVAGGDGVFSSATATAGVQTFASGSVSITKRLDSPTTDATLGASNVTLAKYDVKATGEAVKIEALNFQAVNGTLASFGLRNGSIFLNGTQIGSTKTLCGSYNTVTASCTIVTGAGNSYTQYTFGSSLVVYPGAPAILEVRGDIYDAIGGDSTAAGQSVAIKIAPTTANVLLKVTGTYTDYPASAIPAGTMNIKQGTLNVAKNTSFANQTVVRPMTAAKIGSFTVTSSATEPINITQIGVNLTSGSVVAADLDNLYVTYGPAANQASTTIKTTPTIAAGNFDNSFSISSTIQPQTTYYFNVYADLNAAAVDLHTINPYLSLTATTVNSGKDASQAAIIGQTITISTGGTFTPAKDSSSLSAFMTAGNKTVEAGRFRFTALTENFTINEVLLHVPDAAAAGTIDHVELYNGSLLIGSSPLAFDGNYDSTSGAGGWLASPDDEPLTSVPNVDALISNLSIPVTAGTHIVLTAKYVLGAIGFGAGASHTDVTLTLDGVKYSNSQGTVSYSTSDKAANGIRVMKSVPVVSLVDLTNATLSNGVETELYKFSVTANGGDVALKQFKLAVNWSDGQTLDSMEIESLKLYKNGSEVTALTMTDEDNNTVTSTNGLVNLNGAVIDNTLVVRFNDADGISSTDTSPTVYSVRGTPQGFRMTGSDVVADSVSLNLPTDTTTTDKFIKTVSGASVLEDVVTGTTNTAANFIWSDMSGATDGTAHSDTSGSSSDDWANGYLVLNLPLSSETWTK